MIEEALKSVFVGGKKEVFVPAESRKQQESIRTQAFKMRSRIAGKNADEIGVQKYEEDGRIFVRIYHRENVGLWERDEVTGKLIPARSSLNDITLLSSELQRVVDLMRKDGKSEEEIQDYLKGE